MKAPPLDALLAALDRLTDAEARLVLRALATRMPEQVEREAAYVHERRAWYPDPPLKEGS